eukprot:scaffold1.g5497.t1
MAISLEVRTLQGRSAVELADDATVEALQAALRDQGHEKSKLVCGGVQLTNHAARLRDVCRPGEAVVVLPRRTVAPRPAAEATPAPSTSEINAAIRAELSQRGPAAVAEAELAAAAAAVAPPPPAALRGAAPNAFAALAAALMEGDQGALEDALGAEGVAAVQAQLVALMQGLAQHAPGGGGGGGEVHIELPNLDLAALAEADDEEEDEEDEEDEYDEEEEDEEEDEEEGTDEEGEGSEESEEGASSEDDAGGAGAGRRQRGGAGGGVGVPRVPEPNAEALSSLLEMGFPEALCRNALLLNRNHFERALEWVMEHAQDPGAADPVRRAEQQLAAVYGGRARQRGNGGQVDPGHLAQLRDMGFDSVSAEMALRMFHNHVEAAANWLLHARPMGDAAVPAVAAAAAAVPGNAASSSGAQQAAARQEGQDGQEEVMQQQAQREQQQGQSGLRQVGLRGDGLPPLVTSSDDDEAHAPQRVLLAGHARGQSCQDQFSRLAPASMQSLGSMIDGTTPSAACSMHLARCSHQPLPAQTPKRGRRAQGAESLVLVLSDEFNQSRQGFSVKSDNAQWTAEHLYYQPTHDMEARSVYLPDQVTTRDGAAVITLEKAVAKAPAQKPNGEVVDVAKNFRSGMLSAWNKACFTGWWSGMDACGWSGVGWGWVGVDSGGYVEARVQLPGKRGVPSFWPAIWMMGNLGRAGYMYSTAGQWPYSFNACPSGPNVGPNPAAYPWSPPITPQMFTACGAVGLPAGVSAEDWGMSASLGRGAPEIDIFEAVIPATGSPQVSQTLQMAPVQPPGSPYNAAGLSFPGAATAFRTRLNPWQGVLGRSGNIYQDSISAVSDINDSFFNSFHTFGLDWVPGQYVRWYIDGVLVYGVTKDAVGAASNGTWSVPPRQIPVEAMYIVMNLGMSKDFSPDLDANAVQPLPAEMLIDYVRVYQRPASINVGCSPPAYPTTTFIACNRNRYITDGSQDHLITGTCPSGKANAAGGRRPPSALLGGAAALAAAALHLLG